MDNETNEAMVRQMNPLLKDACAGAVLFLVFLLFFLFSFSIEVKSLTGVVSARSVPQAVSIMGMFAALYLFLKNLLPYLEQKRAGADAAVRVPRRRWLLMAASLLLLAGYVALIETLGFILTSVLYLLAQMGIIAEKKTWKHLLLLAVIALCVPLVLYFPFRYGFKLLLPTGTIFH